jgi:hypothetical protein
LLYIVDRNALLRWGRPVTTDCYVSMDRGPVLSRTLNLIIEEAEPGSRSLWAQKILEPDHYEVSLRGDIETDELSEAEVALIGEVYRDFGHKPRWALVELTHGFGEWQDPHGSAIPIQYRDILRGGGKTDVEIAAIEEELEAIALAEKLL